MKKERIIIIQELLAIQMTHWLLFLFEVTVLGITHSYKPVIWKWAVLSLIPIVLFLIRRYTDYFLLFIAGHIVPVLILGVIPYADPIEKIVFYIFVIGYIIYSFYLRVGTKERLSGVISPPVSVGIAVVCLCFQNYRGIAEWDKYYIASVVVYLCLYYIRLYLEQYQYFLRVNESSTGHIPEKEIFRSGMSLVTVFSVGGAVLLLLTSNIGWVGQITAILKSILGWIIGLLFRGPDEIPQEEIQKQETISIDQKLQMFPMDDAESSLIMLILEKILIIAMVLAFVALFVWLVYSLFKFLYHRFNSRLLLTEDEAVGDIKDVREKCGVDRVSRDKSYFFSLLSTKERIRRIYKKEVWAGRWKLVKDGSPSLLKLLTARESGDGLARKGLAEVYEKARYSGEDCTSEDIRSAKEK